MPTRAAQLSCLAGCASGAHGDSRLAVVADHNTLAKDVACAITNNGDAWRVASPDSATLTGNAEALPALCERGGGTAPASRQQEWG